MGDQPKHFTKEVPKKHRDEEVGVFPGKKESSQSFDKASRQRYSKTSGKQTPYKARAFSVQ